MEQVIITGASSGIGEALAVAFAAPNRHLTLIARREEALQAVAAQCEAKGSTCSVFCADLSRPEDIDYSELIRITADLTILHNAGIGTFEPAQSISPATLDPQIALNLRAPILINAQLLPSMIASGKGQIIHILSMAATHTLPFASAYSATKAGLLGYAKSLAAEVRTQGIRVINILPGATSTPMWGESGPPREEMIQPCDLADLVFQIASSPRTLSPDEILVMPPKGIL